ncbi:MAG: alpha/beta hydrolase [Gammaproteobacteria bacterium]|uniref:Putative membrane protein n=1 Tax=Marinobacter nitratireducens TaxID=1137280 RepID=A0A072MZ70_9GAMM|nr:alpha/beta hydrolase [Marinobacter nitratireducens]KEF30013.1 putative membrane protein [Marinobacter nitratireducens]TNE76158.1 MAG: alpha/beta hydrolase [Gammaproteobacteria bacterium]TNE96617.1 MAG: alpha/beta hydrolase [Gammaproteobacteria bacterium]
MTIRQYALRAALAASAITLSACGGSDNDGLSTDTQTEPTRLQDERTFAVDPATLPFESEAGTTTDTWWGIMESGAGYRVEVPDNWNGVLVMYAHGYRGTGEELTVSNPSLRSWLINEGYAWAASSYSKNYYDVEVGVEDTNELALKFTDIAEANGRSLIAPHQTFIIGHSMGGHITAAAVEQENLSSARNKVYYDGAMPMCGVVGGTHEFDYLLDFTFAAQHAAGLGPDSYPADFDQSAIDQVLWTTPPSFALPGVPTADGLKLEAIVRNLSGGDRPVFEAGFRGGYYNVVMGTGGRDGTVNGILARDLSSNLGTFYQLDNDPLRSAEENTFNNTILRVEADPQANAPRAEGLRHIPQVNGQFSVPVLTLHGLGDLYVPFVHEQIYRKRAIANGNDDLLVQRAIRDPFHCDFTEAEESEAFSDLVNWVNTGIKPAGDNVLDAATVSDPAYGCTYSDPTRANHMASCIN